jgi:hypothetical protein
VVFDGRPRAVEAERADVRFAVRRGPDAADDDIAALAAADGDPATLTVVTSDARLAARVGATGARVVGAGAFRRLLDDAVPGGAQEPGDRGRSSAP